MICYVVVIYCNIVVVRCRALLMNASEKHSNQSLLGLETDRLILRRLTLDDAEFLLELMNDPEWLQYIGDRQVYNVQQAKAHLYEGPFKMYQEHGMGMLAVVVKSSNQVIGMTGIMHRSDELPPDIGYAFLASARGKGYAYEAASGMFAVACRNISSKQIWGVVNKLNHDSVKLLLKLGFEPLPEKPEGAELDTLYFRYLIQ